MKSYRNSISDMRYLNCLLNRRYMQWYTRSSFQVFKIQDSEEKNLLVFLDKFN